MGEVGEKAILADEVLVGAGLDEATLVENMDLVGVADGGEPVGDDEARHLEGLETLGDGGLGAIIEGGSRFIHEEDFGLAGDGGGDEEPLALAAGEGGGVLINDCMEAHWHGTDILIQGGEAGGFHGLIEGHARGTGDIFVEGTRHDAAMLEDDPQLAAKVLEIDGAEGFAIEENIAFFGGIEAKEKAKEGGLAGTRRADHGMEFALFNGD